MKPVCRIWLRQHSGPASLAEKDNFVVNGLYRTAVSLVSQIVRGCVQSLQSAVSVGLAFTTAGGQRVEFFPHCTVSPVTAKWSLTLRLG